MLIVTPEVKVTLVSLRVASLWQVVQVMVPPIGWSLGVLPVVRNSGRPPALWQVAQEPGTAGVAPAAAVFQWLKASALVSAWPEAAHRSWKGTASAGLVGAAVAVGAAGGWVGAGALVGAGGGGGVVGVADWQAASMRAAASSKTPKTII